MGFASIKLGLKKYYSVQTMHAKVTKYAWSLYSSNPLNFILLFVVNLIKLMLLLNLTCCDPDQN